MTKHQTIAQIKSQRDGLTDEQMAALADMTASLVQAPAPVLTSEVKARLEPLQEWQPKRASRGKSSKLGSMHDSVTPDTVRPNN